MSRPRLLDLFCCAGGAAMGYHRAGFDVVGVDIAHQDRYRRSGAVGFIQDDALGLLRRLLKLKSLGALHFDAVHASPPCQAKLTGLASVNRALGRAYDHVDLVPETRALLRELGLPYVIEQPMKGARLHAPAVYCGSSFGLPIHRHRQFEANTLLLSPPCEHDRLTEAKYWTGYSPKGERTRSRVVQVYGNGGDRHEWGPALGIHWMTPDELTQAIPPAYTEHIGRQLLAALGLEPAA